MEGDVPRRNNFAGDLAQSLGRPEKSHMGAWLIGLSDPFDIILYTVCGVI